MNNMILFVTAEEKLCHTCEKPISVGEELIMEIGTGDHMYHHVKCADLCEECLASLRREESEFEADDAAETTRLAQEMLERER